MNKLFKKTAVCLTAAAVIFGSGTSVFACTGYYVGKDVSENGTYMFGHTVDASNDMQGTQTVIAHNEEPGRTITVGSNKIPLPDVTYQYTSTRFVDGNYDGATANEMGLAVTGAVTTHMSDAALEMDPYTEDGIGEAWICAYLAATCSNAQEAITAYGKLMEEYGSSESNTFILADQKEAWYLESYTGHQWVAVKCPDDAVAVYGNQCMLSTLEDYTEGETLQRSEGLYSEPEEAGIAVYDDDGNMDMFLTYCGMENLGDYSNLRTWYGHHLLAESTAGEYDTQTRYDLFYKPDDTVSLTDMFELTRCRYEGSEWCPEETGDYDSVRVIGVERQVNCSIVEIYPDYPAAMCAVTWASPANAEHTPYIPLSNLITDVADAYDYVEEGNYGYNLDYAHVHFKRLAALSEQDRTNYGAGVREYWSSLEEKLTGEYSSVLSKTADLYENYPIAAAEYITDYTVGVQEDALKDADTMYDELTWYMIQNTLTMKFEEQEPFVPSILDAAE